MLQKLKAARAAAKSSVAPVPTPAPPSGPATVESLGQQLREVLPTRRVQSVSLCDHEANVLWLSEGALGPDEHMLVMEALEVLATDSSLPCHETALEDGRLSVFLPVRAPTGSLVGVAMILADSKSVGDDTLERMTAAPVRTIMQRLAVLLKPSGVLQATPPVEVLDDPEPVEVTQASEVPVASEAPEPEPEPETEVETDIGEAPVAELELALVAEMEVAPAPAPAAEPDSEDVETIITAAEIASILELELVPDEPPTEAPAAPAAAPAPARRPAPAAAPTPPRAAPAAKAPAPPVAAAADADDSDVADSGMLRLEFLAEPPVVRPPPNPTALAKKLQAASKAAEVAPTRAPRPLPTPAAPGRAAAPAQQPAAPAAKSKTPAPVAGPSPRAAPAPARNPFEPLPTHSRLSLKDHDDVVVLFESEPATKAPPPASNAPPAKPAQPTRMPVTRAAPPARTSPAVRNAPAPRPVAPAARPAPAAPAAVAAPVAATPPPPAPAVAATPAAATTPATAADVSPPIDLVPYAKLRSGGQIRRFQVQPRAAASARDPAALDEQTLQQLLAWLGGNRAQWSSVPTSFTVNLSIATLEDERFLGKISAALNTHGISGETLGFEIAESLCVQQRARVERFISQCERIGAWVAIDDFSFDSQVLPLLRSKGLRMLKLDARLTAAALRDKLSQAMVVATVQAAKVLGIHCSAKKADSHASLQYLAAIGLDFAQGAALSRAVPLDAIATVTDPRAGGASATDNI